MKASALGAGHIVDQAASFRSGHTVYFQIDLGNMDTSVRQRLGLDAPMSVGLGQDQTAQPLPCPSPPPSPFVNLGKGLLLPSPPSPPPKNVPRKRPSAAPQASVLPDLSGGMAPKANSLQGGVMKRPAGVLVAPPCKRPAGFRGRPAKQAENVPISKICSGGMTRQQV